MNRLGPEGVVPPLSARARVIRSMFVVMLVTVTALLLQLTVVSSFQQRAQRVQSRAQLRGELAIGTAPTGPRDAAGGALAIGTPIASLQIPSLDLDEVIREGTSSATLLRGPGHRRDSAFPGQVGTSVIYGRQAAWGGPFSDIDELRPGALIRVTTGQGSFLYAVRGVRGEGDLTTAPAAGEARLVLTTASGTPFFPDGVIRVDAELQGSPAAPSAPPVTTAALRADERAMGTDVGRLWALAFWLQALIVLSYLAVLAWHRWGRAQAWIVMTPLLLLVGLAAGSEAALLLPNLT